MAERSSSIMRWAAAIRDGVLERDNFIIGVLICAFATYDWLTLYDGMNGVSLYFSQGIYSLSSLTALNTFFSAVYLTIAAIILLSLKAPLSRYTTAIPNLMALVAAFAVYLFIWAPSGNVLRVSVYVALSLILLGSIVVIVSLVYLRQAFSVTPQARFLVSVGPYAVVRHPMYIGNLITLAGYTLLVDSKEAILLFFVCGGLQIGRALYEEKLLRQNLPGYSDYARKVGRFFPRIRSHIKPVGAALALYGLCSAANFDARAMTAKSPSDLPQILSSDQEVPTRIAADAEMGKKCEGWYKKAIDGGWFTNADERTHTKAWERDIEKVESCKPLLALQDKCQELSNDWSPGENDADYLTKMEATKGCRSIVGFDNVCTALKGIAGKGIVLSEERRAVMAECLLSDVRKRRTGLLRPAM
jgi:protein-S-isoprenylcysteine O-methyltransferase Ste14